MRLGSNGVRTAHPLTTLNERRVYRGMEDEKGIVKTNSQTNLSNLYKLSPTVEDREEVQGCIDIMNK